MKGTILLTGATKRVGFHLAQRLQNEGYQIVAIYRTRTPETKALESDGVETVSCDLADRQSLFQAIANIRSTVKERSLRAIIHNASAYYATSHSLDKAIEEFDEFYAVHMLAPYVINESFRKDLVSNSHDCADIIHITDVFADRPIPDYELYCATKASLSSLTKSLAWKYAPAIQVNEIAPANLFHSDCSEDEFKDLLDNKILLSKEGGAESVYLAVEYLLNHHFTTGTVLTVDGGRSIR